MLKVIQLIIITLCCSGLLSLTSEMAWSQPKTKKKMKRSSSVSKAGSKKTDVKESMPTQKGESEEEDLSQTAAGKVIEFSQFTIEGTIPRPSAAYLLQRRKLKFRGLTPKKSFLPALFKSVERPPF